MSDPRLDALAETARNRGLKLVRSRIRTPGKRRFGKVGLTDAKGKPVFGMDAKGPTESPDAVEEYLRGLGARDWGASLDVAAPQRKRTGQKPPGPPRAPANDEREPKAVAKPTPAPKSQVRAARPADAREIVTLNRLVGADADAKTVAKSIRKLAGADVAPLVATLGKQVIGVCAIHLMVTVHRDRPVGRISHLVVAEALRGQGIGRMLVEAAERQLKKLGCGIVEVTSNDRLAGAHAFYRHMRYERTSIRFCKSL